MDCRIVRDDSVGIVECRKCTAKHECVINHLEEEIDVYSRWIDALEQMQDKVREEVRGEEGGGDVEEEEEDDDDDDDELENRRARKRARKSDREWTKGGNRADKGRETRPKPVVVFTDDEIDE